MCDINDLVYEVVKRLEEDNISQKLSISINPDLPLFKTDKGMLEQVIYNLLINAVTYTPVDSHISLSATAHADLLELVIEDEGPGFPADEIRSVFDKFYRLKNTAPGGTGLGLSIVKGFTEALDGSIDLHNKNTGGARFTLSLSGQTSHAKDLKNG